MITYLLKSGILLLIFFAVYKLALENEKMFRFNRVYLLLSLSFSFIIPLQFFSFETALSSKMISVQLDELVLSNNNRSINAVIEDDYIKNLFLVIYAFVLLLLVIRFVWNITSFYKKTKKNEIRFIKEEKVVLIAESILPHSFWNNIFINKEEFENGKIPLELIAHEKAHLEQKHTLDILFVEVLQIIFWFNPLLVLYKKAIKLNHEFLADEAVNKQFGAVKNYQNLLLDFASNKNTISLASNINYLITKKRLLMMTKKESSTKVVFKALAVSAVYILLLFVFSTKSVAQEIPSKTDTQDKEVYMAAKIEKQPVYPGGMIEFYKFVGANFKMPNEAAKNKVKGKAYLQFVVEKDGSLTDLKVLRDIGYGIGDEAVRVLKLSPKWNPGMQDGKPVRVMYSLPITIQTDK